MMQGELAAIAHTPTRALESTLLHCSHSATIFTNVQMPMLRYNASIHLKIPIVLFCNANQTRFRLSKKALSSLAPKEAENVKAGAGLTAPH